MANSLLAFLYSRIKGSQEDTATLSLNYILGRSEILCSAFTRLLSERLHLEYIPLAYSPQVIGKQKERPDIVGFNGTQKRIIIEAKFFASLTENQPNTYLASLDGQGGLVFLCPESRLNWLWDYLVNSVQCQPIGQDQYCVDVNGTHMAIVSWYDMFSYLQSFSDSKAPESMEDLHQLWGYCKQIEESSFFPFSEDDFDPGIARSIDRYYYVVDETVANLFSRKDISATKFRTRQQAQWFGLSQYLSVEGIGVGIHHHREIWKKSSPSSPFSLEIFSRGEALDKYLASLGSRMVERDNKGIRHIVLKPPIGLELRESAQFLADQVIEHVQKINALREKE